GEPEQPCQSGRRQGARASGADREGEQEGSRRAPGSSVAAVGGQDQPEADRGGAERAGDTGSARRRLVGSTGVACYRQGGCVREVQVFEIAALRRDPELQVRRRVDPATVQKYATVLTSGNEMPPISVGVVDGVPLVLDGWHRLAAREQIGLHDVEATVQRCSRREAFWLAAQANLRHGLPLKPSEQRAVFRAFIRARKHRKPNGGLMSYREITRELGGGRSF